MIDQLEDDLQDYMNEFSNIANFDAEDCPQCELDDTKKSKSILSWVIISDLITNENLNTYESLLKQKGIHHFFTESEKTTHSEKFYVLKVLNTDLSDVRKILNI